MLVVHSKLNASIVARHVGRYHGDHRGLPSPSDFEADGEAEFAGDVRDDGDTRRNPRALPFGRFCSELRLP